MKNSQSKETQIDRKIKAPVNPRVIYGEDNRMDFYEVSTWEQELARSTVALISSTRLTPTSSFEVQIKTRKYAVEYDLCSSEKFYNQETAAFCSGSLVGKDLVLTAGHCIQSAGDCADTKFVFDFAVTKNGENPQFIPTENVYSCAKIIDRKLNHDGADYSLVQLDRVVIDRNPLEILRDQTLLEKDEVFVIGHPAGLPTKIAGGATIRSVESEHYIANLDTYGGNSGSAVFSKDGKVAGILVRGEKDYVDKGNCMVSNICTDEGCSGEDVTRIDQVAQKIPVQ